jgi:hypothetical protein
MKRYYAVMYTIWGVECTFIIYVTYEIMGVVGVFRCVELSYKVEASIFLRHAIFA